MVTLLARNYLVARKTRPVPHGQSELVGQLEPLHHFFLNPYPDVRFTNACPSCEGRMRQRKVLLAIHVDGWGLLQLGETCRYCSACDLLIANQDEVEGRLTQVFDKLAPELIGNGYLVLGTIERGYGQRGRTRPLASDDLCAGLHDFQDYVHFDLSGWVLNESSKPR
jgi:hypothetical protein